MQEPSCAREVEMAGSESNVCDVVKNVQTFFLETATGRVVLGIGVAYVACKVAAHVKRSKRKEHWKEVSKDKVVLHQFPRGKVTPNISPYCLKLETFLRMAKIPYEVDNKDIWGPKGKTPYITVDGEDIPDSQLCIQFLTKRFGKDMSRHLTEEQRAASHMLQVMVDEHLVWGIALWRYVYTKSSVLETIQHFPWFVKFMFKMVVPNKMKKSARVHGIGRHSPEEVEEVMAEDLKAISTTIGKKKFLFGDEPCEADCAVFAQLVQVLWNSPGSNFAKLSDSEMPNLREYCLRMRQRFWKDWDQCLYKGP